MSTNTKQINEFEPQVVNPSGQSPILLVCEHASAAMPPEFDGLGLDADALQSHIAWDPGALETAMLLSQMLDATLVHGAVSRLIYDCNRPPEAPAAIPTRSEVTEIPGNQNLSDADRQARVDAYYHPFEALLKSVLDARADATILVTIHSFTPVYFGKPRDLEIGMLHHDDARLADALLDVAQGYRVRRNEPYGPSDGVMHTLERHAISRGHLNVMIEIRNDLIGTPMQCERMADVLSGWLTSALVNLDAAPRRKANS